MCFVLGMIYIYFLFYVNQEIDNDEGCNGMDFYTVDFKDEDTCYKNKDTKN